ncbi:MAG: RNA-directed DNA polymerase [Treponema sp.]|nr:RNA-directed DNA polymerase [Treponema sp.]
MTSAERRQGRYERRKAEREEKRKIKIGGFDSFDRITDIDNLNLAFRDAKKKVHWKESVQRYEMNRIANIIEARRKLIAGENIQQGFIRFTLRERGKKRDISGIQIGERVPVKCLCDQALVPILSRPLIYDNGASLKGKGVMFSVRRLIAHLSRYFRQAGSNEGYALMIDFKGYYDNVDHNVLIAMLQNQIRDRRIMKLTEELIRVFGDGKALGLGSQVSQIAAIYYPNILDHFIKEKLRIKFYGRYMDDLYLIHRDKDFLEHCLSEIQNVCETLKITINLKKTCITKLSHGLIFLKGKYSLLETGKVLRLPCRDSPIRMKRKLKKFKALLDADKMGIMDIRNAYQSWRGAFKKRFQAYKKVSKIDALYDSLFS